MSDNKYCFLEAAYENTDGEAVLYELAISDRNFTDLKLRRVNKQKLIEYLADSDYTTDFVINSGYLACNPSIITAPINNKIAETENAEFSYETADNTIYAVIEAGIANKFVFMSDNVATANEDGSEVCVVPFLNLSISDSTMSMYVQMVHDGGMYNKMILCPTKSGVEAVPFYFGVPDTITYVPRYAEKVCNYEYRGVRYFVYRQNPVSFVDEHLIASHGLVNCAIYNTEYHRTVHKVLRETLNRKCEHVQTPDYKWVGGTDSHTSDCGVTFTSTLKLPNTAGISKIVDICLELCSKFSNENEALEELQKYDLPDIARKAARILIIILTMKQSGDTTGADTIATIIQVMTHVKEAALYAALYTYRVRMSILVRHIEIGNLNALTFDGGGVDESTTINVRY